MLNISQFCISVFDAETLIPVVYMPEASFVTLKFLIIAPEAPRHIACLFLSEMGLIIVASLFSPIRIIGFFISIISL